MVNAPTTPFTTGTRINRKLAAAIAISVAMAITTGQDVLIKWISGDYPFHQMQTMRCTTAMIPVLVYLAVTDGLRALLTAPLGMIVLRGSILAVASVLFYLSAVAMPFAEAVALYFTMPIGVALFAGLMLGERVGWHRIVAIVIGFAGIVAILRPGIGVFEPAALLALSSAVLYSAGNTLTRAFGRSVSTGVVVVVMNACYFGVAALIALVFGWGGLELHGHPTLEYMTRPWVLPTLADAAFILGLGFSTGLLMILFTLAYRLADASFVAPFEYTGMIWAIVFSFLLWREIPDVFGLTGMALIAAGGLFMLAIDGYRRREHGGEGSST